jgi:ribosome-associated protein
MEDISKIDAQSMAGMLETQGARDLVLLDVRKNSSWTDFMIIATITSYTQAQGLERNILEEATKQQRKLHKSSSKAQDEKWHLFDCGDMVINLMTQ